MSYLETSILNNTTTTLLNVEEFLDELADLMNYDKKIELSVVFCGNNFIQDINYQFRNQNSPTDVLAFPSEMDFILGDIVISLEKAKEQATNGLEAEIKMLLCHGFLHLLGYDHEKSEEDHLIMMELQAILLEKIKQGITIS